MYSNQNEFQKFSVSPPPSAPPLFSQPPATGIPVSSTNQFSATIQYSATVPHAPTYITPQSLGPWTTGLCDCCKDCSNCCITCWCPCITFGRISEMLDKGSSCGSCGANGAIYTLICLLTGCPCCYSCFYRSKMRSQYFLNESPCGDCLVHCCCEQCALCQEYRELKNRGFDPAFGWHATMERHGQVATAPVTQQGMSR